jgi:hypothetical protein
MKDEGLGTAGMTTRGFDVYRRFCYQRLGARHYLHFGK